MRCAQVLTGYACGEPRKRSGAQTRREEWGVCKVRTPPKAALSPASSRALRVVSSGSMRSSGHALGPSESACAGSGWVSMKRPETPAATAARGLRSGHRSLGHRRRDPESALALERRLSRSSSHRGRVVGQSRRHLRGHFDQPGVRGRQPRRRNLFLVRGDHRDHARRARRDHRGQTVSRYVRRAPVVTRCRATARTWRWATAAKSCSRSSSRRSRRRSRCR